MTYDSYLFRSFGGMFSIDTNFFMFLWLGMLLKKCKVSLLFCEYRMVF